MRAEDLARSYLDRWVEIGLGNPWITTAWDPPFTRASIKVCSDRDELLEFMLQATWCLGQGFALGEICFINQIDGGREWLTIKGETAFESITIPAYGESPEDTCSYLFDLLDRLAVATEAECFRLDY